MKWIKLTQANNVEIFVNIELALDIFSNGEVSTVSFGDEYYLKVKESPCKIVSLSNEKNNNNDIQDYV